MDLKRSRGATMKLTDIAIKKAKAHDGQLKLFDGGGLFLLVEPTGGKLWRYKYYYNGAERKLAIGESVANMEYLYTTAS